MLSTTDAFLQALFFHLRTTKDDMLIIKRQAANIAAAKASQAAAAAEAAKRDSDTVMHDATDAKLGVDETNVQVNRQANEQGHTGPADARSSTDASQYPMRQSWEYVEEVVQILKTAFPLLIMSMETIVEQINSRLKPGVDEDIYRLMCMLMQDAMVVSLNVISAA